ncbi:RNA polymerase sigma factor [Dactylosporangium cerinum]|uniref:RNA polymerase sigma factor n=1 Tax=Dactylosporangium cerinum TaxID=1434730 RepID=A0ABV9WA11_9ACTN
MEQVDVESRRARFAAVAPALIEAVRRYLARRTDPAAADDVLSETLLVCWRRLDELPDEPLAWVYAGARNCLANAERARRRQDHLILRILKYDPPGRHTGDGMTLARSSSRRAVGCRPLTPNWSGYGRRRNSRRRSSRRWWG